MNHNAQWPERRPGPQVRQAALERKTNETQISGGLILDPTGLDLCPAPVTSIHSGIGFFDHMLDLLAFHSGFILQLEAQGDLYVDDHHTVEDIGIWLGDLFKQALGDKRGLHRYGSFRMPMDESLAVVDLDFSGRPYLVFDAAFHREKVGDFSTEMVREFLRAFCDHAGVTLHVHVYGENDHHQIEAIFKALGRALKQAVQVEGDAIPSSKGMLEGCGV